MKKIATIFLIIISAYSLQAQSDSSWLFRDCNSVNFNALGNCIAYSFTYERIILNRERFKIGAEIGSNFFPIMLFPISTNAIASLNKNNHLEFGGGVTFITWPLSFFQTNGEFFYRGFFPSLKLGYRHQNPSKKNIFKIGLTPIIIHQFSLSGDGNPQGYWVLPWIGISYGRSF